MMTCVSVVVGSKSYRNSKCIFVCAIASFIAAVYVITANKGALFLPTTHPRFISCIHGHKGWFDINFLH